MTEEQLGIGHFPSSCAAAMQKPIECAARGVLVRHFRHLESVVLTNAKTLEMGTERSCTFDRFTLDANRKNDVIRKGRHRC